MTEPTPSTPSPEPAPGKSGAGSVAVLTIALLSLGIAAATWVLQSRRLDQLQQDIANLQSAHRELATQVIQGRTGGSGPSGKMIDVSKAPARGRADAVVTLVEFSDYECPFCIRHFTQTMPRLDRDYIQTGKIRYVFRDFPIDQNHPQAIRAHEAGRCALEQNKFWELHPHLFSSPGTHTPSELEQQAKDAGLNMEAFRSCIASGRTTSGIRDTGALADSLGATGTPWFFVGLRDLKTEQVRIIKPLGGALPYEQFAAALDAAIKDAATN